ncbi:flp pilus assembly protein TadG [Bacteroides fragilis CAG:558]|nr:flp pilus assembly protein TadG [Bacteroides fragilis CAG:558]
MLRNAHTHPRISSISDHRLDIGCIKMDFFIKNRIFFTLQSLPIRHCFIPLFALRSIFTPFDVFKSHFIGSNHTATGSHLNRKITECQPAFHCQTADCLTGVFYKITGCTAGRHFRHHIKSNVLGCNSLTQFAIYRDTHSLGT